MRPRPPSVIRERRHPVTGRHCSSARGSLIRERGNASAHGQRSRGKAIDLVVSRTTWPLPLALEEAGGGGFPAAWAGLPRFSLVCRGDLTENAAWGILSPSWLRGPGEVAWPAQRRGGLQSGWMCGSGDLDPKQMHAGGGSSTSQDHAVRGETLFGDCLRYCSCGEKVGAPRGGELSGARAG
jgi:hypothetical protein